MPLSSLPPAQLKHLLRIDMKAARSQFNELERARAALGLCHTLWPWLQLRIGARVGVYLARSFEISLDPLISCLLESGVEVGAPRLDLEAQKMTFFRLRALDAVQSGPWNVPEPTSNEPFLPSVVLAPALALDKHGHRLGTGGGWYDRTLSPDILAVGVAFDFQIVEAVPVEPHDRAMNWVFSEKRALGPFDFSRGG